MGFARGRAQATMTGLDLIYMHTSNHRIKVCIYFTFCQLGIVSASVKGFAFLILKHRQILRRLLTLQNDRVCAVCPQRLEAGIAALKEGLCPHAALTT
jgi:glucose uptake protein GlcU